MAKLNKSHNVFLCVSIFQVLAEGIIDGMQLLKTEPCCTPSL